MAGKFGLDFVCLLHHAHNVLRDEGREHAGARYYNPTLQRFMSEDPERGKANLFSYGGNNPVSNTDLSGMDFNEDSGGGGYDSSGGGTSFDAFTLLQFIFSLFGQGPSASPTPPNFTAFQNQMKFGRDFGTAGIDDFNVYSQGHVIRVQEDDDEGPESDYGWAEGQIRENVETARTLDEEMSRPGWAHDDRGFLTWLLSLERSDAAPLPTRQVDAIVREARRLGLTVRPPETHDPPNKWTRLHINIKGRTANAHVLVPSGYKLP